MSAKGFAGHNRLQIIRERAMLGQMMTAPLLISSLIDHAARYHGDTPLYSVQTSGGVEETSWANVAQNARRLGSVLTGLGLPEQEWPGAGQRLPPHGPTRACLQVFDTALEYLHPHAPHGLPQRSEQMFAFCASFAWAMCRRCHRGGQCLYFSTYGRLKIGQVMFRV